MRTVALALFVVGAMLGVLTSLFLAIGLPLAPAFLSALLWGMLAVLGLGIFRMIVMPDPASPLNDQDLPLAASSEGCRRGTALLSGVSPLPFRPTDQNLNDIALAIETFAMHDMPPPREGQLRVATILRRLVFERATTRGSSHGR